MNLKKSGRLADAENTLEACSTALELIPVALLRKGYQWIPSEECIELLSDAKDALDKYSRKHNVNGNTR